MSTKELFIGYCHKDLKCKEQITTFMRVLEKAEQVNFHAWSDDDIQVGDNWEKTIAKAIQEAKVALLLISADFLASDYIMNQEIPQILSEANKGQLIIIPFVIRPCPWEFFDWIRSTQGYVDNSKALSGQSDHDAELILTKLVREIGRMVTDYREETEIEAADMEASVEIVDNKQVWEQPDRSGPFTKGTFLTNAGLTSLIENSTDKSDRVIGLLKIFQTHKQQTWFVVTGTHFYCVLDDEKTSAGRRQIQWKMLLSDTEPIHTKQRKNSRYTGLVDIGYKRNWLYSYKLHPDENIFKDTIRQMIQQARTS